MSGRYIVLPARGVRGSVPVPRVGRLVPDDGGESRDKTHRFTTLEDAISGTSYQFRRVSTPVPIVDELPDGQGAKLVELDAASLAEARATAAGARIVRERTYRPAVAGRSTPTAPPDATVVDIHVRCASSQRPLEGAAVTAIVDEQQNLGASGVTDAAGNAQLAIGTPPVDVAQLRVRPPRTGAWGACAIDLSVEAGHVVELQPLDLTFSRPDALRYFYAAGAGEQDGAGVSVGVIDTGIDAMHPDLAVAGGLNTVAGEPDDVHGDNGLGHGTHVAGIIAAHGSSPRGLRGVAPAAKLWSLRVYGDGAGTAGGYAIVKALIRAQDLGCDLVNLSLEAPEDDASIQGAIEDAAANGVVVIGAAGNGGRKPVASPARYASAVTALGRRGTYPVGSLEEIQVAEPSGNSADDFLAAFSNHGDLVDFTAPGLGVVSTVPGGYSPDQGTSMAAAAATGMAARLLSAHTDVLEMSRDQERTTAILSLLTANAKSMGLGFESEGYGML